MTFPSDLNYAGEIINELGPWSMIMLPTTQLNLHT